MCGHMVVQSSVFFLFQLKRCTARLRPIQAPHLIYLQYECITLWFGPEPGQMSLFSSVDKGAVPYCVFIDPWPRFIIASMMDVPFTAFYELQICTMLVRHAYRLVLSHYSHFSI